MCKWGILRFSSLIRGTIPDWALNWPLTQNCIGSMDDHTYVHTYIKTNRTVWKAQHFFSFFLSLLYKTFFFLATWHWVKKTQTSLLRCTWKYLQCMVFNSVLVFCCCCKCLERSKMSPFCYLWKRFSSSGSLAKKTEFMLFSVSSGFHEGGVNGPSPLYNEMYTT